MLHTVEGVDLSLKSFWLTDHRHQLGNQPPTNIFKSYRLVLRFFFPRLTRLSNSGTRPKLAAAIPVVVCVL